MKKTLLGLTAILLYIQIRILNAPLFWKGVPNIKTWLNESKMVKNDIVILSFVWMQIWSFLLFGWIGFAIFAIIQVLIVLLVYVYTWVINYINKAE